MVENQERKLRHLSELKENSKKYTVNINKNGTKKAPEIPQNELRKPKELQAGEVLPFISTFNPKIPPAYYTIKNSV